MTSDRDHISAEEKVFPVFRNAFQMKRGLARHGGVSRGCDPAARSLTHWHSTHTHRFVLVLPSPHTAGHTRHRNRQTA